jgi:hypothetical protein
MVEPLLSGIVLGLVVVTLIGLFVAVERSCGNIAFIRSARVIESEDCSLMCGLITPIQLITQSGLITLSKSETLSDSASKFTYPGRLMRELCVS